MGDVYTRTIHAPGRPALELVKDVPLSAVRITVNRLVDKFLLFLWDLS
jgi:hypothetical protein